MSCDYVASMCIRQFSFVNKYADTLRVNGPSFPTAAWGLNALYAGSAALSAPSSPPDTLVDAGRDRATPVPRAPHMGTRK